MKFGAEALTGAEEVHWELLMSTKLVQPGVNIISLTKFFEHRQKVEQLGVVHVVKPRHHRDLPDTDCHSQTIGFDASLNKTYKHKTYNLHLAVMHIQFQSKVYILTCPEWVLNAQCTFLQIGIRTGIIIWFQPLRCDDLLLFFVMYETKLNVSVFWDSLIISSSFNQDKIRNAL